MLSYHMKEIIYASCLFWAVQISCAAITSTDTWNESKHQAETDNALINGQQSPHDESDASSTDLHQGALVPLLYRLRARAAAQRLNYPASQHVDHLNPLVKRRQEMGSSGFYGDAFTGGMGTFDTMKKRRPEMGYNGFYGDAFTGGLGQFDTMRKRRPEMGSSGFYGDAFTGGLGQFETMKRNWSK